MRRKYKNKFTWVKKLCQQGDPNTMGLAMFKVGVGTYEWTSEDYLEFETTKGKGWGWKYYVIPVKGGYILLEDHGWHSLYKDMKEVEGFIVKALKEKRKYHNEVLKALNKILK